MKTLYQDFQVRFTYPVYFTRNIFSLENAEFAEFIDLHTDQAASAKLLFVIDKGVSDAHSGLTDAISSYVESIANVEMPVEPVIFEGGEGVKNNPMLVEQLVAMVDDYGIDRHSFIVAIGGGALLDMVGYVAAISHRGVRHIRIPTTVLSQNDSGIGVKNGVNFKGKKNFLGSFTPPVAVFNDRDFLDTLDDRNWLSGISEAVKVALIKDKSFYEFIKSNASDIATKRNSPAMQELIYHCADLHMQHIRSGDPFEFGSSRPLDFGHWSAHKLEQLTNFELLHGEAVAIGIAIDTVYSFFIGNISEEEARGVLDLFLEVKLPIYNELLTTKKEGENVILLGLEEFREHLGGQLTVTLLKEIGLGQEYHQLDSAVILQAIEYLKNYIKDGA